MLCKGCVISKAIGRCIATISNGIDKCESPILIVTEDNGPILSKVLLHIISEYTVYMYSTYKTSKKKKNQFQGMVGACIP